MSKESYIRGFCKAAEAAGVDPGALAELNDSSIESMLRDEYIRQKRIAAIKNALIAAAIGGLGGGALTACHGGDGKSVLGAGATSAAASGLTTYLLNRFTD